MGWLDFLFTREKKRGEIEAGYPPIPRPLPPVPEPPDPSSCPRCKSMNLIDVTCYGDKYQKWLCGDCNWNSERDGTPGN